MIDLNLKSFISVNKKSYYFVKLVINLHKMIHKPLLKMLKNVKILTV